MVQLKIKPSNLISKAMLWVPIFVIFTLSTILTLSPAVKYRTWDADLRWMHWIGSVFWLASYFYVYRKSKANNKTISLILYTTFQLLIGVGLIIIWRLNSFFGFKQTLWMVFSSIIVGILFDHPGILQKLKRIKYVILITGIILIILTFFFGTYPGGNGPKLWLGVRGIFFQPSELLKILLIIFLASYFSETPTGRFDILQNLFPTIILVLASFALLVFQRDLGTALIFMSIYILMIFAVYGKRRILLVSFLILIVISLFGYKFVDLVRIRFQAWIFPWYNAQTSSYQIIQSIIAIAAGGLFGTGLGLGYPNIVPLSHSDFIFSAIAEEMGVLGSVSVLLLFGIILFSGNRISIYSKNRYHRYLSIGLTCYILTQSILIIGGNIRLLPITGVTLPFMSYGGSSLLVSYLAFGTLQIISNDTLVNSYTNKKPYRWIAAFFTLCLAATALTIGWWGIINANDIQMRGDNPRNLIANLFVKRGSIFGRNNNILAYSEGNPGDLEREYSYPGLSNTIGYFSQKHGLAGIEASSDPYLRGYKGYPSQKIWQNYLLYDQPPEGRPIRLTISLDIQQYADNLLINKKGSIAVLDANSGDIIALSTSPYFDANQLDENWDLWQSDKDAPLINRATQGAYPIGGLISPLIFAGSSPSDSRELQSRIYYSADDLDPICNRENVQTLTDSELLKNGCYSTIIGLGLTKIPEAILTSEPFTFFNHPPEIGLTTSSAWELDQKLSWMGVINGENMLRSNPLQLAASYLPLSNDGYQIAPHLISAVNISSGEWIIISDQRKQYLGSNVDFSKVLALLKNENNNTWKISTMTHDTNGSYAWYVAGSLNAANKNNYVIAIVLENGTREEVSSAGSDLMRYLQVN